MSDPHGDSSAEVHDDPREELRALVRGFRGWATRQAARGVATVSARPGAPVVVSPVAGEDAGPGEAPAFSNPAAIAAPDERAHIIERDQDASEDAASQGGAGRPSLPQVRAELGECTRCKLHRTRQNIVFGVGDPGARLMFVGEAPGADEDRKGEPFVGRAGQLLDRMILAMGWTRDTVYIANVLKCRPPGNRDPEPDEITACRPFLARQIDAIAPRVIVTLGRPATHLLLETTAPISALRGKFSRYRGIKVMPTFHPAFLLRSPHRKRDTWSDLKQVIAELERLGIASPHSPKT